ncbi:MAG: peptidoglycan DD-metalloendopeptidase family protein, partial [Gammaproteobacteria bacterium]
GYYTVKPGDTMIRIGLETGQNWRDIARWNNLENPNVIEVGQVLRVIAPTEVTAARAPAAATAQAAATSPSTTTAQGGTPAQGGAVTQPVGATAAPAVVATAPATTTAPASRDPDEDIVWTWPASGPVASPFDDARNKGLAILGKAGDPVLAAADGRVVYSGAGLRGYGNLVIVKHNNTYLSAYAHNQSLLVKEDQIVRRGQKIAEMGSTDAERVQLHFEIRRQGRPIDPSKLLPPR